MHLIGALRNHPVYSILLSFISSHNFWLPSTSNDTCLKKIWSCIFSDSAANWSWVFWLLELLSLHRIYFWGQRRSLLCEYTLSVRDPRFSGQLWRRAITKSNNSITFWKFRGIPKIYPPRYRQSGLRKLSKLPTTLYFIVLHRFISALIFLIPFRTHLYFWLSPCDSKYQNLCYMKNNV